MTTNTLFRIVGLAAFVTGVAAAALFIVILMEPSSELYFMIPGIVTSVALIPVLYGLYAVLRSESPVLSAVGFALGVLSQAISIPLTIAPITWVTDYMFSLLFGIADVLLGVALLLFNYLGYRGNRMPRVLCVLGIIAAVVVFAGVMEDVANLLSIPIVALWVFWLGYLFVSNKLKMSSA